MINEQIKIIVYYISVGNIDDKDVDNYMDKIKDKISLKKELPNIKELYIPIRSGDTHIEVLSL